MSDERPEAPTAADRRLDELLGLLAAEPPTADPGFSHTVVRRARVQRVIAGPLRSAGTFAAAIGEGLRALLGLQRSDRP
jgi:hypothetical protein